MTGRSCEDGRAAVVGIEIGMVDTYWKYQEFVRLQFMFRGQLTLSQLYLQFVVVALFTMFGDATARCP